MSTRINIRRGLLAAIFVAYGLLGAQAFYPYPSLLDAPPASSGVCSQYSNFVARTSGLTTTQKNAYQTMICGMVSDGTWSLLDALYVFATNTTATALLNLMSTSYPLSESATLPFTANLGFTGDGVNYLSASANLSAYTKYQQNSATIGECDLTNRTTPNAAYASYGVVNDSAQGPALFPYSTLYQSNDGSGVTYPGTATSLGSHIVSRTSSTAVNLYVNGSAVSSYSASSIAVPVDPLYILALNASEGFPGDQTMDTLGYIFVGAGMNATQVSNMQSRLAIFLSAVGAPAGC